MVYNNLANNYYMANTWNVRAWSHPPSQIYTSGTTTHTVARTNVILLLTGFRRACIGLDKSDSSKSLPLNTKENKRKSREACINDKTTRWKIGVTEVSFFLASSFHSAKSILSNPCRVMLGSTAWVVGGLQPVSSTRPTHVQREQNVYNVAVQWRQISFLLFPSAGQAHEAFRLGLCRKDSVKTWISVKKKIHWVAD